MEFSLVTFGNIHIAIGNLNFSNFDIENVVKIDGVGCIYVHDVSIGRNAAFMRCLKTGKRLQIAYTTDTLSIDSILLYKPALDTFNYIVSIVEKKVQTQTYLYSINELLFDPNFYKALEYFIQKCVLKKGDNINVKIYSLLS